MRQVGFEDDESLIASAAYSRAVAVQSIEIFGHHVPLMLLSYVGALKSWLYAPIFHFWKPSVASLRVPAILGGVLTIWLFYRLLLRIAGGRAAAVGCLLLSADTVFLLTTCFDWGPVMLQHLLVVGGVLCVVRFHQEGRIKFLAIGFFLFGLALWDKALFAWIFGGMAVAALIVFPRELWKSLRLRNIGVVTIAFCLGAAPLIYYNISFPLITFRSNTAYSLEFLPQKIQNLFSAMNGSALFGYLARVDPAGQPRDPQNALESVSVRISEMTTGVAAGYFRYALLASILLIPLWWSSERRRPILFSILAMLIAWLQMLVAKGAGNAAHHVILLWPFPTLIVAVALAEAFGKLGRAGKALLAVVVLFLVGTNSLVTNRYFTLMVCHGGGLVWTDAIFPLADALNGIKAETVYIIDWGMFDTLRMVNTAGPELRRGDIPLSKPQLDAEDRRFVSERLSESGAVFVGHTDANELFKGVNENLRAVAKEGGYHREMIAAIPDRNGRAIFEVFRFVR
jgi:4-amino-4-deoxy-L-arabinose transferase-like glycosyltransferase